MSEPLFLPPTNGRASQTFLRHYNACPRSAYLSRLYKDEELLVDNMARGSVVHEAIERCIRAGVEANEPMIPPELAKAIVNEVLAEVPVPFENHDVIREQVYRWASQAAFDPELVVAIEDLFVLDVAGWQVRCKVDFAQLSPRGESPRWMLVQDFKSSRAAPAYEEIARTRADGSRMGKEFQLILYGLVMAFGKPVHVDTVQATNAQGWDRVEVVEDFSLGAAVERFDLEYVFPAIENSEGKMATRSVSLTRPELSEYMGSLEALLARLGHSYLRGEWPAVVSSAGCAECPAPSRCPIPAELRDHRGTINTMVEAEETAERLYVEDLVRKATRAELREFAKKRGRIRFGRDMAWDFKTSSHERIRDKDAMLADVERTVRYGEPFDRDKHIKMVDRTEFDARPLSADELREEDDGDRTAGRADEGAGPGGSDADAGDGA